MHKLSKQIRRILKFHRRYLVLLASTAGIYFVRIFLKILSLRPDGLYAGHPNAWSDWSLHIAMTNIFANKPINEWFIYHPYFSGGKLTYPFLTNAISGLLMKLGLNITTAMIWPSILFILTFIFGTYFLFFKILSSRKKAILGIFIFLTSAGPGFINFLKDLIANPGLEIFAYPPIDYTRITKYSWLAGNIPTAMLIPQRAFLLGVTISVLSLLIFIIAIKQKPIFKKSKQRQQKLFIIAGLLAGTLPITHMHSFIAVVLITGTICLMNYKNYKKLLYFVIPAGIFSSILYFSFVAGGIENPNFMKISIGWTSEKNLFSWMNMWWDVWGIMMPVAIYSLIQLYKNKKTKENAKYFFGFFAIFILANVITFQPVEWDNTKLFAWAYFGFSLLAANLIVNLWKDKKIIAIIILVMLSSTGVLELIRLQRFDKNTYIMISSEEMSFSENVMKNTSTDDVFLTASAHNHPIQMWATRSIVLGYKSWVLNFGFEYAERESDVRTIYRNPEFSSDLIKKYDIDYIVIGPDEIAEFNVNKKLFDKLFHVKFQDGNTYIYEVKKHLLR